MNDESITNGTSHYETGESVALEWKERGNVYYGRRDFEQAAKAYQAGLDALPIDYDTSSDDSSLFIALRSNLAMVLIKIEQFEQAEEHCTNILKIDPQNTKGKQSKSAI